VVDRVGARRASIASDLLAACAIGAIPALHAAGHLEYWHVLALAFAAGAFEGPGRAARLALVPDLSARADLPLERTNGLARLAEHIVGSASATTAEECQPHLATPRTDTVAAQSSFAKQHDFDRLVAKLDAAATKLSEGKDADAVQKLVDFQTTLNALATAAKPKVDSAVAQALITEAQAVIDCINAIGPA